MIKGMSKMFYCLYSGNGKQMDIYIVLVRQSGSFLFFIRQKTKNKNKNKNRRDIGLVLVNSSNL